MGLWSEKTRESPGKKSSEKVLGTIRPSSRHITTSLILVKRQGKREDIAQLRSSERGTGRRTWTYVQAAHFGVVGSLSSRFCRALSSTDFQWQVLVLCPQGLLKVTVPPSMPGPIPLDLLTTPLPPTAHRLQMRCCV